LDTSYRIENTNKDNYCPFAKRGECREDCVFYSAGDCMLASCAFYMHELLEDRIDAATNGQPTTFPPIAVSICEYPDTCRCDTCGGEEKRINATWEKGARGTRWYCAKCAPSA